MPVSPRALLLVATLCGTVDSLGAEAATIWWSDQGSITRFTAETGHLEAAATSASVRAVLPLNDNGAWLLQDDRLVRVDASLKPARVIALGSPQTPAIVAADGAGDVWVAQGPRIRHFDASGEPLGEWQHAAPLSALAVAGDAVWAATGTTIEQFAADGSLRRSIDVAMGSTGVSVHALLLDRAGGYLWAVTETSAIQLDVFAGLVPRARVAVAPGTAAIGLDAASGTTWHVSPERVSAFDRDAAIAGSFDVPRSALSNPSAVTAELLAKRVWIADARGTTAFNHEALQWMRVAAGGSVTALAGPVHTVAPTLESSTAAGEPSRLRLRVGSSCRGAPCAVAERRYVESLVPHAMVDGIDISADLIVDRHDGAFEMPDWITGRPDVATVNAWVVDAYGVRSAPLEIDIRALRGAAATTVQPKANALPNVTITAPANNARIVAPATVAIAASASDSDGTIAKVEFYRDGVLLATDTVSPYTYSWSNVAAGTYSLTAKAYDNAGGTKTSAVVTVVVTANVPPTVAITAPANNASYTAPATINIAASASDSDGFVAKVDFYQGATKIGTDTTAPYAFTWSSVAGGTYSVTAKATDDKGSVTTSSAITVKVNKPPTVTLTAPANNAVLVAPANVTLQATASDSDGSVTKVEFYRNGTLLGADTTSPYSYLWNNAPTGTHTLTAKATDNLGAITTSAAVTVNVNANQPPSVALTSPATGAAFVTGVPVVLTATATDADGTIAKVEFYSYSAVTGRFLLGSDTTSPYSITTPLYEGTDTLTAVAIDNKGGTATSAPVVVNVAANRYPAVTLVSPTNGQAFPSTTPPDITLVANASDPDGNIVDVKFYAQGDDAPPMLVGTATVAPYQVVWNDVPPTCDPAYGCTTFPGSFQYLVWAEATDNGGLVSGSDGAIITVPDGPPWSIRLTAPDASTSRVVYAAPATIVMIAQPQTNATGDPIVSVEFFADGSPVGSLAAANGSNGEFVSVWRNVAAGSHVVAARLHDAAGFTVDSAPVSLTVRNPTQPPTVALTSPVHEQIVLGSGAGNLPLAATAADADGSVASVAFVVDDVELFTTTSSPYAATWSNVPAGLHVLSARAADNGGGQAWAKPAYVHVNSRVRAPSVVLASPAPAPATVTSPMVLVADAVAPDLGVQKVEFYRDTTLIGTVTSPPYRLTYATATGTFSMKAVAYALAGSWVASTPVTVVVSGSNAPPQVALTAPSAGQSFAVGSTVTLTATASDVDGTVAKVDFFAGTALIGTATTAPYNITWVPAVASTYSLTARATDNQGAVRNSAPVSVTVSAGAPFVSLTAPSAGTRYAPGQAIAMTAQVSTPGHTLSRVEFSSDGVAVGPVNVTGGVSSAIVNFAWSGAAVGGHALSAKAIATDGFNVSSFPLAVTVTDLAVGLVEPFPGQSYVAPGVVRVSALPSETGGTIAAGRLLR